MAEIHLCASASGGMGGPSMPTEHGAVLVDKAWPGGGTVKHLKLFIGDSSIEIWPADASCIKALGEKLILLANSIRSISQ